MKTKVKTPKMLREVWKMKERVYNEVKEMDYPELFKYVEEKTSQVFEKNQK